MAKIGRLPVMEAADYQAVGNAVAETPAPQFDYVAGDRRFVVNARVLGEVLERELALRGFKIVRLPTEP